MVGDNCVFVFVSTVFNCLKSWWDQLTQNLKNPVNFSALELKNKLVKVFLLLCTNKCACIPHPKLLFHLELFFSIYRSDSFRGFVDYCLQKIPQERPSSTDLLRVIFHIFSRNFGKICLCTKIILKMVKKYFTFKKKTVGFVLIWVSRVLSSSEEYFRLFNFVSWLCLLRLSQFISQYDAQESNYWRKV